MSFLQQSYKFKCQDLKFSLYDIHVKHFKTLKAQIDFSEKDVYELDLSNVVDEEYTIETLNILVMMLINRPSSYGYEDKQFWTKVSMNLYRSIIFCIEFLNPTEMFDVLFESFKFGTDLIRSSDSYLGLMLLKDDFVKIVADENFGKNEYEIHKKIAKESDTYFKLFYESKDNESLILNFYEVFKYILLLMYHEGIKLETPYSSKVNFYNRTIKRVYNGFVFFYVLEDIRLKLESRDEDLYFLPELNLIRDLERFIPNEYEKMDRNYDNYNDVEYADIIGESMITSIYNKRSLWSNDFDYSISQLKRVKEFELIKERSDEIGNTYKLFGKSNTITFISNDDSEVGSYFDVNSIVVSPHYIIFPDGDKIQTTRIDEMIFNLYALANKSDSI